MAQSRYNWLDFDLAKAKSGMLIGVRSSEIGGDTPPDDDEEEEVTPPENPAPNEEPTLEEETGEGGTEGESEGGTEGEGDGEGDGGSDDDEGDDEVVYDDDLTYCGVMQMTSPFYSVSLDGHLARFDANGLIMQCDTLTGLIGKRLHVVDVYLAPTMDTRAGGDVEIDELEVRDQFAMAAMQGMISKMERADMMSDGGMMAVSQAAYRWAQAMMNVAAKYRSTEVEPDPEEEVTQEEQTE